MHSRRLQCSWEDRFKKQPSVQWNDSNKCRQEWSGKPSEWSCFTDFLKMDNDFFNFIEVLVQFSHSVVSDSLRPRE